MQPGRPSETASMIALFQKKASEISGPGFTGKGLTGTHRNYDIYCEAVGVTRHYAV
jgi:hypothetical protein